MSAVAASVPVLEWATQRAHLSGAELQARFPKWLLWLSGQAQPTLKQLEDFARLTHTPFAYFFLPEPPHLTLYAPDFRTLRDQALTEPSPNLLDTLYLCQQRQDWYREHARMHGQAMLRFVVSASADEAPAAVARRLRRALALPAGARRQCPTWADALRQMITSAEDAGVLVMVSSIVGNNSDRALGVGEFRGFALADQLAPLIFLNGTDSKVAQMFTLAHELAHLRLDARGVCDMQAGQVSPQKIGRWCNQVAAELLVPLQELVAAYRPGEPVPEVIQRLARQFKVSTLVVLRRLFDAGHLSREALWQHYRTELERLQTLQDRSLTGGAFYRSLGARSGKRLARALVGIALEGLTLLSEAYRLLGVRKTATFRATAQELGVTL